MCLAAETTVLELGFEPQFQTVFLRHLGFLMIIIESKIRRRPSRLIIFIIVSLLILTLIFCWAYSESRQFGRFFWYGFFEVKAPAHLIKEDQAKGKGIYYIRFVSNLDDGEKIKNQTFDYQNSLFREFTVGAVLDSEIDPKAYVVQYYLYPEDAIYFGNIPNTVMSRMGGSNCTGKCTVSFNGVTKVKGFYFNFTYIVITGKLTPSDFLQHEKILESSIKSFIELNQ
jgi:hypothetical protein